MTRQRGIFSRAWSAVRAFGAAITQDVTGFFAMLKLGGDATVTEPMRQSGWVYAAVQPITKTMAGAECRLVRGDGEGEEVTSGPAYDLLQRPAPGMTCEDLIEEIVGHLVTGGEAHVFDPEIGNSRPQTLVVAGKSMMTETLFPDGSLKDWKFRAQRSQQDVIITPEWNSYIRLFNPYDPWRGLGPLQAAKFGISQDYKAAVYNDTALSNGARAGGHWSFPDGVSKEQIREYKDQIESQTRGIRNANVDVYTGGGVTYDQLSFKNVDLQLYEGRRMNREEIFAVLGVPPVMGNVFDAAHYNVADAAQETFLLNTIIPLAKKIEGLFNARVLPMIEPGVRLVIDFTTHPVMIKIIRAKIESLKGLVRNGTPYNEAIEILGMPLAALPWGNKSFLESGLETPQQIEEGFQIRDDLVAPDDEVPDDTEPEDTDDDDGDDAAFQAAAAKDREEEDRMVRRAQPAVKRRFKSFFLRQQRQILARLKKVMAESDEDRARFGFIAADSEAERTAKRVLLELRSEQSVLRKMVAEYFPQIFEAALRERLKSLGFSPAKINQAVKRIMSGSRLQGLIRLKQKKLAGIEIVTRTRIQRNLAEGITNNETLSQLSERVRTVLGGNVTRANLIARNEAGQAVATGRFLASAAAGTEAKGWIHGANPRATHLQAQVRYNPAKSPIPFDEKFRVGNSELMFPRDPNGEVGEIINCNCTMVPRRKAKRSA